MSELWVKVKGEGRERRVNGEKERGARERKMAREIRWVEEYESEWHENGRRWRSDYIVIFDFF